MLTDAVQNSVPYTILSVTSRYVRINYENLPIETTRYLHITRHLIFDPFRLIQEMEFISSWNAKRRKYEASSKDYFTTRGKIIPLQDRGGSCSNAGGHVRTIELAMKAPP